MEDVKSVVIELNEHVYEILGDQGDLPLLFVYQSDGYSESIELGGMHIWDNENDSREYDEVENKPQPLFIHILEKVKNLSLELNKITNGKLLDV